MGLELPSTHPYRIELEKWDRPWVFKPWPAMVYKAQRRPDGIISVGEANDAVFGGQPGAAEAFSKTCQRIVQSEDEKKRAYEEGWRENPRDALAHHEAIEQAIADAAAHRNYEDRSMSEAAKREAEKVDQPETLEHTPVIPETPRQKRKYVRKVKPAVN